ncbi:hypothetical protein [Zobellella denitrificans]|uniref:hypothetical protein n=1 Tax=Zobellella denitrificans TaxID=347534 RepID=UPI0012FD92A2|nr:hypothetical protein [Zobellella denitrificans]
MQDIDNSLTDFSKHLLVTIFAIFAFTSSSLLGASNFWVKVSFMSSLIVAVLGMTYGFNLLMIKINYHLTNPSDKKGKTPKNTIEEMKKKLQLQYYLSILSLSLLILSIGIFFATENYYLISIKP